MQDTDRTGDSGDLVIVRENPFNAETPLAALRLPTTPTSQHYVRSNFSLPTHDSILRVGGMVERPLSLTLDNLRQLPTTTMTVTLECAGNGRATMAPLPTGEPWKGTAVATATWTGTLLADLLRRVGPRSSATTVVFTGADHGPYKGGPDIHFARSLPLAVAQDAATGLLIAYEMNGEPLPPDHGAPFRLVVPGWYGMASVKWLVEIEVRDESLTGQFQTSSYVYEPATGEKQPVTRQRVRAIITDPAPGDTLSPGRHMVRGKTWSGAGPVVRVEFSADAEEWSEARLEPPIAPGAWQEWSCEWQVSDLGRHALRARATDAAGNVQPDLAAWNRRGYGNNAIQPVLVDVRESSGSSRANA